MIKFKHSKDKKHYNSLKEFGRKKKSPISMFLKMNRLYTINRKWKARKKNTTSFKIYLSIIN